MAERLNKRHQDMVRQKIRASQLINRLENHILPNDKTGEVTELTSTQVTAALGLLKKCIPDLKSTELTGAEGADLFPKDITVRSVGPKS